MASGSRVLTIVMHVMSSLPIGLTRLKTMRKCKLTVTYNTISCIVLVHYRGHDSAFVFYVLCDNVFISLLMCVLSHHKKVYLLTYLLLFRVRVRVSVRFSVYLVRDVHPYYACFPGLRFRSSVSIFVTVSVKPCPYCRSVTPLP